MGRGAKQVMKEQTEKPEWGTTRPKKRAAFVTPTNHQYYQTIIDDAGECQTNWTLSRHARPGDFILLYVCAPVSAIVAVGVVASKPEEITDPQNPWFGLWQADIEQLELLDIPLLRSFLLEELPDWKYFRMPRNSVRVPDEFFKPLMILVIACRHDMSWVCGRCGTPVDDCHCPKCLNPGPEGCECGAQDGLGEIDELLMAEYGPTEDELEAFREWNHKPDYE